MSTPHIYKSPFEVIAALVAPFVPTATTSSKTLTGITSSTIVPFPNCPHALYPHIYKLLSFVMAPLAYLPTLTETTLSIIFTGISRSVFVPSPN